LAEALQPDPWLGHGRVVARVDPVARIDIDVLSFPLDPPFRAAVRLIPSVDCVLCRVATRDGIEGTGYAFAFGTDEARALAALARLLGDRLVGQDALATDAAWTRLWTSIALLGQPGAGVTALSALDMALWDIKGRALGIPLFRLLGAARSSVPTYGSGGSLGAEREALLREMEGYRDAGHGAVKMKLGRPDDIERVRAVREALGEGTRIIVDATQHWTPKPALAMARALEPFGIWWLEEPVPAPRIDWCAQVCAASPIPIATGETNFTTDDFRRILDERAADILMPNLQRVGGITPWLKVAAAAAVAGIPVASHVSAEINSHLLCAIPNGLVLECVPWWPRLFSQPLELRDGHAFPPERPGFGFDLDPDVLARHRVA
jgi:L-alanine-DL-glutamate epimerase-like enolase superfamily enzyme